MSRVAVVIDSSDESDSDARSSSVDLRDELVDVEAVESNGDAPFAAKPTESTQLESFPQFRLLPPELRRRVWEFFCPDLTCKGRVLQVNAGITSSAKDNYSDRFYFFDGMSLADQTERIRVLSAVHQESRSIAVKTFPDWLHLHAGSGDAEVLFNRNRDIVLLNWNDCYEADRYMSSIPVSEGLCDKILHVGFIQSSFFCEGPMSASHFYDGIVAFLENFPNARTALICQEWTPGRVRNKRWGASRYSHQYRVQTFEKEPGLGENLEWIYCWPDLISHADFSKYHVIEPFRKKLPDNLLQAIDARDVKIAPMLSFEHEGGAREFNKLVYECEHGLPINQDDNDDDDESSSDSEADSHPSQDDYESEGIDDSVIIEEEESSEDELVPRPISAGDSTDTVSAGDAAEDHELAGRFSSPEPDPAGEDEGQDGTVQPTRRAKRRIVSDSDDDSDGEPAAKRIRTETAVSISSEEDEDEPRPKKRGSTRRRPLVVSSDHDGADDADDADGHGETGSSSLENEEQPPARLSLAERLRQFRDDNPIPSDDGGSDDNSHEEDLDDEDKGEDEDEDEDGNGLIDDMAEDSDEDGGSDGDSEEGW